ncbi:hypothetical protein FOA52_003090 [Chlamydomonas sp. UWO 241]|nr:hypothetical protein FOA52_003090 [Chlamydomonas sp. UWO 241]
MEIWHALCTQKNMSSADEPQHSAEMSCQGVRTTRDGSVSALLASWLAARGLGHSVRTSADNGLIALAASWVAPTKPVNTTALNGGPHSEPGSAGVGTDSAGHGDVFGQVQRCTASAAPHWVRDVADSPDEAAVLAPRGGGGGGEGEGDHVAEGAAAGVAAVLTPHGGKGEGEDDYHHEYLLDGHALCELTNMSSADEPLQRTVEAASKPGVAALLTSWVEPVPGAPPNMTHEHHHHPAHSPDHLAARDLGHSVPMGVDNGLIALAKSWVAPTKPVNTTAHHAEAGDGTSAAGGTGSTTRTSSGVRSIGATAVGAVSRWAEGVGRTAAGVQPLDAPRPHEVERALAEMIIITSSDTRSDVRS